jgi:RNase P/RNase MRP subunit p30
MPIDLNIVLSDPRAIDSFLLMAKRLGFNGFAAVMPEKLEPKSVSADIQVLSRYEVREKSLGSAKRLLKKIHKQYDIIAIPLGAVDLTNWAAKESAISLLSVKEPLDNCDLRDSTAKLAASSGTALEIPISTLLQSSGLVRSKILKSYRAVARTAIAAGMRIILSNGCKKPIHMRSPMALSHIGLLLGLNLSQSKESVYEHPHSILNERQKELKPGYLGPGIELVEGGEPS